MNTMFKFSCFFITLATLVSFSPCFVDSFAPASSSVTRPTSELCMSSSRRDVLAGSAAAAAASLCIINPNVAQAAIEFGEMTEQSRKNKANESYQGVYFDPNHPDGYRVIRMAGNGAVMTLSDGGSETFREIPVRVDNNDEFVFDFSFKNGPKNLKAKLSPDKQSITFEDGNTWIKNYYKYDGIYKVTTSSQPLSKDAYRIIRRNKPEIIIEMNDTGNPKDSYFVDGSVGTLFSIPTSTLTFYFGGKENALSPQSNYSFMDALYDFQRGNDAPTNDDSGTVVGQLSLIERNTVFPYGTITFPDKTVWTRI